MYGVLATPIFFFPALDAMDCVSFRAGVLLSSPAYSIVISASSLPSVELGSLVVEDTSVEVAVVFPLWRCSIGDGVSSGLRFPRPCWRRRSGGLSSRGIGGGPSSWGLFIAVYFWLPAFLIAFSLDCPNGRTLPLTLRGLQGHSSWSAGYGPWQLAHLGGLGHIPPSSCS